MSTGTADGPLSKYKICSCGVEKVGHKYKGYMWISLTGAMDDPTYQRLGDERLHDTPEAAKFAVEELFRRWPSSWADG